ncbi:MAG TPA: hypothetical protein VES67_17655 [Vicinamibacterales bacterium]|nr:hypothetical protein [Vicinamibacterales bacterium]
MTFADSDSVVERARCLFSRVALGVAICLLAAGVVLAEVGRPTESLVVLESGAVILLAIPILNAIAALLEEIGRRDWPFVAAGALVIGLVAYSVIDKIR